MNYFPGRSKSGLPPAAKSASSAGSRWCRDGGIPKDDIYAA